jgi:hypothetical protein
MIDCSARENSPLNEDKVRRSGERIDRVWSTVCRVGEDDRPLEESGEVGVREHGRM